MSAPHLHHHHDHHHPHTHPETSGFVRLAEALHLPGFAHDHALEMRTDPILADNELGIRTVKVAFAVLGITTLLQIFIYLASGSVALLADTVHNLGDALNSLPLLVALLLARRPPNRRYTYGYGRAEDIAGLLIVVSIAFSAGYILYESIRKLIDPQPLDNLGWVVAAAIVGFIGNEIVATLQIHVGRKIGSEAMVADGLHARTDGLTSLAVIIAVIGVWLGAPIVDPIVGILIGITIVGITWGATKAMWYRLMDAVDPHLVEHLEHHAHEVTGVESVQEVRVRWVGHQLQAEMTLTLSKDLSLVQANEISEQVRHDLQDHIPHLTSVKIYPAISA